jgi:hypothetical protein
LKNRASNASNDASPVYPQCLFQLKAHQSNRRIAMKAKTISHARELSRFEIEHISGGMAVEGEPQGDSAPEPLLVIGKKGTEGPLPIFIDLP